MSLQREIRFLRLPGASALLPPWLYVYTAVIFAHAALDRQCDFNLGQNGSPTVMRPS